MNAKIYIEGMELTKKYASRVLFTGISFSLKAGECLAFTGPNGSGKSTLLKIIAGIIRPSGGSLKFNYDGVHRDAEERLSFLGMVAPEMQLYELLSGMENLIYLAGSREVAVTPAQAAAFCDSAGLGEKGSELVKTYSTGMRQRLKLALLMAVDTPVWLLDEPSSNLDRAGRQIVFEAISQGLAEGRTIILATNDEAEAAYAHKTIALS